MNRDTERTFRTINAAISAFCGTTREAYKTFNDAEAKAKAESAAYKDEKGEYKRGSGDGATGLQTGAGSAGTDH